MHRPRACQLLPAAGRDARGGRNAQRPVACEGEIRGVARLWWPPAGHHGCEQYVCERPRSAGSGRTVDRPSPGRRLSSDRVLEIADRLPKMRGVRAKYRGSYGGAYLKGPGRWQVSYFSRPGKEIGQVIIADANGRVLEQWTGFQVAWTMARGYPGAFGRHVNALYIWLPLCLLFLVAFVDWRRPFSLLHLDLLALLSFSVSLAFFNHGTHIRLGSAHLPAARLPARADAGDRRLRRARQPTVAELDPRALAGSRRRLPAGLSHRLERHGLQRDRRRLRGGDRGAAHRRGQAALRALPE